MVKQGRRKTTVESIALTTLAVGSEFYTKKNHNDMTAIASYYKKKISTEGLIIINPHSAETQRIVKVTIL